MNFKLLRSFSRSCLIVVLAMIFSVQIQAQSSRVLVCNEKDTVSDTKSFPRQAIVARTARGPVRYLQWRSFIGNDPGSYKLTLWSNDDFAFEIFEAERKPDPEWRLFSRGKNARQKTRYGRYLWDYTFRSRGIFSEGSDILVRVYPYRNDTDVTASWYTTGCRNSEPKPEPDRGCRLQMGGGLFGTGMECVCNGVVSPRSKCS